MRKAFGAITAAALLIGLLPAASVQVARAQVPQPPIPQPPIPQPPSIPPLPTPPLPPIPGAPGAPESPWLPANAGLMWFEGTSDLSLPDGPAGEPNGALWLTRRIATHPYVPGLMYLGTLMHGGYVSIGGAAWASTTPGCLLPRGNPLPGPGDLYGPTRSFLTALSGLDVCSLESVAFDPLFPYRVYATGYQFHFPGSISPGGVYVSDDFGLNWRKVIGGVRGNGLAVARSLDEANARIVAGFIQQNNGTVGSTPSNGSLMISDDDGEHWRAVVLPSSGCPDTVVDSQRITPTVRMHPLDSSRIYVGTNAGLYVSSDGGQTWRLARQVCGGVWGIGLALDGSRVVIGDRNGQLFTTNPEATSFSYVGDVGNKVQDVVVDPLNRNVFYASTWEGGAAATYRARAGGGVTRIKDPNLSLLDRAWPSQVPQPFPFSPENAGGVAPSLFLSKGPGTLHLSTLLRGVFARAA